MRRALLLVFLLMIAGCAAPMPPANLAQVTPAISQAQMTMAETSARFNVTFHEEDGEQMFHASGQLESGEGLFVVWPFNGTLDGYSFGNSLRATGCPTPLTAGPALLALHPSVLINGTGGWQLNEFFGTNDAAYFRVGYGPGDVSLGLGAGGGSSEAKYVGTAFAIAAAQPLCFDMTARIDAKIVSGQEPIIRTFHGKVANYGSALLEQSPPITHVVSTPGWTHVQRAPCGLPAANNEFPKELVKADAEFPNGWTVHSGLYLNGIFPGPTLDAPEFFGTFNNTAGPLTLKITSPAPSECILVVETDLAFPQMVGSRGYTDAHPTDVPSSLD